MALTVQRTGEKRHHVGGSVCQEVKPPCLLWACALRNYVSHRLNLGLSFSGAGNQNKIKKIDLKFKVDLRKPIKCLLWAPVYFLKLYFPWSFLKGEVHIECVGVEITAWT